MMAKNKEHKAVIETIINTAAIALTATRTTMALSKEYYGFLLITFGIVLELIKYMGRARDLW